MPPHLPTFPPRPAQPPHTECQVDVLVEMKDATTVIPRNSLIEANQSGLIAEPLIDITPQAPVPQYKGAAVQAGQGREVGQWAGRYGGSRGGGGGPYYSKRAQRMAWSSLHEMA